MLAKKTPIRISSGGGYQQELEHLYVRKTQIDNLIESLQEYDRLRAKREETTRKSA